MSPIVHLQTVSAPFLPYGADIHELYLQDLGASLSLTALAGYGGTARLASFDLAGTLSFSGDVAIGASYDGFVSANFGTNLLNLSVQLTQDIANVAPGQTVDGRQITSNNSGLIADQTSVVGIDTGSDTFVVMTRPGMDGIASFLRAPSGALTLVDTAADPSVGEIYDIVTFGAYGETWIVATSPQGDAVHSYMVDQTGALSYQASYGAAEGLGINNPVDVTAFQIGGQPYFLLAAPDTNSLSVLRLEADGSMTATDHILDDLDTRFADPSTIKVYQTANATYALAAGSDDGFSLFEIDSAGQLHLLGTVVDTAALSLNNVAAADLIEDNGTLHLVISSSNEVGISHFTFDISNKGADIVGSSLADTLLGTTADETILGGAGDDLITGGAGDDRLSDGDGADQLTGGTGADVFVLGRDGDDDTITDFERGIDALDLSFYPLLHDFSTIAYVATSWGARLTIQGEILDIYAQDGATLSLAELQQIDPFPIDRPPLILSPGGSGAGANKAQVGTAGNDTLVGGAGDDILTGNGGDDVLIGGAGADQILGGSGFDIASYATAISAILLDMENLGLNTSDAAGDSLSAIEGIRGSGFDDDIRGTSGQQTLEGGTGNDRLDGRGGDDRLDGGAGADTLIGGAGADVLIGGSGVDLASYATSTQWVRADLGYAGRNLGDASGDSYWGIEDLGGSPGNDFLYGDGASNSLSGGDGDDWLSGRGGDDVLNGDNGDDVLSGGPGSDMLNGGAGVDRVDYSTEKTAARIDLGNSANNAGAAAGDVFSSIEHASGTRFDDVITGSTAANRLWGLGGDDTITGGGGDDVLIGGAGDDVFIFAAGFGQDQILDFGDGADRLSLSSALLGAVAANDAAVLAAFATDTGADVVLDFGGGQTIVLIDVDAPAALSGFIDYV